MTAGGILQTERKQSLLDPRTKLLLLVLEALVVLGGAGGSEIESFRAALIIIPFVLLAAAKRYKTAVIGGLVSLSMYGIHMFIYPHLTGFASFLVLMIAGLASRLMPGLMMGSYTVATTTVSEFVAAMERMHIPNQLTIPLSVMFRFFPTVREEFSAINAAMRMRDIRFGGTKALQMLEYRLVPMISCSVKIGEELSAAALTRGLGGEKKRTNICVLKLELWDILVFLFTAAMVVYWTLRRLGVMG